MPIEEVNAWGTYDQTAKAARLLSNRNSVTERRSVVVRRRSTAGAAALRLSNRQQSIAPQGLGLDLATKSTLQEAADEAEAAEAGRSHATARRSTDYSTDWSQYFDKLNIDRKKDLPGERRVSTIQKDDILPTVQDDIRKIFSVYFEGTYQSSCDHLEEEGRTCRAFFSSLSGTMPWLQGYIRAKVPLPSMVIFVELCLRGIGQVYFQNNPLSGLLILIGLFVQSTRVAVHGIIAIVSGNLAAYLLGFDEGLMRSGLFGYNSLLVGLALATFYGGEEHGGYSASVAIATIVFSCFSSVLFVMMGKLLVPYKSPPLTLPFNVAVLMYLLATANMARVNTDSVRVPDLPDYHAATDTSISPREFFAGVVRGMGQVFLADEIASGLLVFVGITVCSRIAGIAALVGSALGAAIAVAIGVPGTGVENGLFGFNCSLSFVAMFMFYTPSKGATVLASLAGIMTVIGQQALSTFLEPFGLPFMTLPFCVVALPFIILQGTTSLVIAVPLSAMTVPEDHFKKVKSLRDGFGFLKEALHPENSQIFRPTYSRQLSKSLRQISDLIGFVSEEEAYSKANCCSVCMAKKRSKRSRWKTVTKDSWVLESAPKIFDTLDRQNSGHIYVEDFTSALNVSGLTEKTGVRFATLVFDLMDLDKSNSIEKQEFVVFALVSRALTEIRKKISRFFDFVDADGNECIDFFELDDALEYLGEPELTESDRQTLVAVMGIENEDEGIDIIECINYVTIAKIKAMVSEYSHATNDSAASEN